MRRVVVSEFVSLDGVMEAPDKWHFQFWHEEMGKYKYDELFASDALLLGRVTYEGFAAAWPSRAGDDDFADRMNDLPKYVVSTSLEESLEWNNSSLIKGNTAEEVSRLKQQPGQDILIAGSADLVNTLMPYGLIDEYRLMIHLVWCRRFSEPIQGQIQRRPQHYYRCLGVAGRWIRGDHDPS
jgi:dihydrofolate reductase